MQGKGLQVQMRMVRMLFSDKRASVEFGMARLIDCKQTFGNR